MSNLAPAQLSAFTSLPVVRNSLLPAMGNIMGHTLNPQSLGLFLELPPHMQAGILGSPCASLSMWIFPSYGEGICLQPEEMFFRLFQVQLQRQDYILAVYHQAFLFFCLSLSVSHIYISV